MTPLRRWALWALGLVLLVAVPLGVRSLPAAESPRDADDLLRLVQGSVDEPHSGFVETTGTLQLPLTDEFEGVGSLFGESTRMRVWWHDDERWRVNRLQTAGEIDLIHEGERTVEWDYERSAVSTSVDPDIRLPRTVDLIPGVLGDRVVSDAEDAESLPSRRVAGVDAAGLRVTPAAEASSIRWVDLWADPETGIPIRVEVVAVGSSDPSFVSEYRELETGEPPPALFDFAAPSEAEVSAGDVLDIADAANRYAPLLPPGTVAGLSKSSSTRGAVGVYGEGLAQLIAIPLREREAGPLREQLTITPGAELVDHGVAVSSGPLGVLLTEGEGGWLIAGTVTTPTLVAAAADLLRDTVVVGERR